MFGQVAGYCENIAAQTNNAAFVEWIKALTKVAAPDAWKDPAIGETLTKLTDLTKALEELGVPSQESQMQMDVIGSLLNDPPQREQKLPSYADQFRLSKVFSEDQIAVMKKQWGAVDPSKDEEEADEILISRYRDLFLAYCLVEEHIAPDALARMGEAEVQALKETFITEMQAHSETEKEHQEWYSSLLGKAVKVFASTPFPTGNTSLPMMSKNSMSGYPFLVNMLAMIAKAQEFGEIKYMVNGAGVSTSQAPIEAILKVDLCGTAVLLEEVGKVIAKGGCGVTISSQSGWRMPQLTAEEDYQLAMTPTENLLDLEILRPENIRDTLHAYQMAKRCNEKRVMAECVKWGKRGARLNDIAPGIIVTPLAIDESNGPRGDLYKNMFAKCPAGRPGTANEVANVAELLMSDKAAFITGSTFLCDGGATSSYFYGDLRPSE